MANRVSVFCCSKKYYPFIMKVNSGADSQITIPTTGGGYNYDLRVQGGQVWYGLTGSHTINFPSANTDYFIEISGEFPQIYINNNYEKDKFLDVVQVGDIKWKSFNGSFYGASNLTWSATDIPEFKNGIRMNYAFANSKINPANIASWQWSKVNNIRRFFRDNSFFNQDISNLDFSGIPNDGGVADDRGFELFIHRATSFDNNSQPLIIDFQSKTHFLGTNPFSGTKVKEFEFLNARNISWDNWFKFENPDTYVERVILEDYENNINFGYRYSGSLRALTGAGMKEMLDRVDITAGKILSLYEVMYDRLELYLQGLGYTDIQDYLTSTSNTWTVIRTT